jgi:hypothetical protein
MMMRRTDRFVFRANDYGFSATGHRSVASG